MTSKQKDLTKNFFALGLMFWLYERSMDPTMRWIDQKFGARPGRRRGQHAGPQGGLRLRRDDRDVPHDLPRPAGDASPPACTGTSPATRRPASASSRPSKLAKRSLFYGSYPITPASDILHQLSAYKHFGVRTFQAEDEIAAIGAAIGASYGGALALTGTSGPGIDAQVGGHGPRRHDGAPAGRHRRPARRPVDGHADQDRAGRPAPGAVRAQRRVADPRGRPGDARRVLHARDRGGPHRPQVHDPGRVPVRRVRRQRRGAVAGARRSTTCRTSRSSNAAEGDGDRSCPTTRDPETLARPWAVPARRASSTASAASRRPTAWATSATTRRTTTG